MYSVEPYPEAESAIAALPVGARAGYDDAVKLMGLMPWNGDPYVASNPDGNMRTLVFGPYGNGLITYLILEDHQRVDVLEVQWVG